MGEIIASHNTRILRQVNQGVRDNRQCNCRVKADCPLGGQCLASSLVYKGEISTDDPVETRFYIGACSSDFKLRLANHKKSFRHERYSRETTLRAATNSLATPDNLFRWGKRVDPSCKLCKSPKCTLFHILNHCKVAVEGHRYDYRHDSLLNYDTSYCIQKVHFV